MILPILLNKTKLLPIYVLGMGTKEHQDHLDALKEIPEQPLTFDINTSSLEITNQTAGWFD